MSGLPDCVHCAGTGRSAFRGQPCHVCLGTGKTKPTQPMYVSSQDIVAALTHALNSRLQLYDALRELVWIIDEAGLMNLSNGVQLGQASWFMKATDRMNDAREALKNATATTQPPEDGEKL